MVKLKKLHLPLRKKKKSKFSLGNHSGNHSGNNNRARYGGVGVAESLTDHAQHESSSFFRHHVRCNSIYSTNPNSNNSNHTATANNSNHTATSYHSNYQQAEQYQQEESFYGGIESAVSSRAVVISSRPSTTTTTALVMGGSSNADHIRKRRSTMLENDKVTIVIPKASMGFDVQQKMNQYCTEKLIDCQRRLTKLYGRQEEIFILQQELDQLVGVSSPPEPSESTPNRYRSLIQICGQSGEGKTALALQLQGPAEKRGCFFVMGKFDLANIGQPYSGIKTALSQLIQEKILKGLPPAQWQKLRDELCQKLTWEIELLCQFLPELALLAPKQYQQQTAKNNNTNNITAEEIISSSSSPPSSPGNNKRQQQNNTSGTKRNLLTTLKRTLSLPKNNQNAATSVAKKRNSKTSSKKSNNSNNSSSKGGRGGFGSSLSYRHSTLSRNSNNTNNSRQGGDGSGNGSSGSSFSYRNSTLSRHSNRNSTLTNNSGVRSSSSLLGLKRSIIVQQQSAPPEQQEEKRISSCSLQECTPIEEADEDDSQHQEIKTIPNNNNNIKRLSLGVIGQHNRSTRNDSLRRSSSEGATTHSSSSKNERGSKRSSGGKRSSIWSFRSSMFINRKRDSLGNNLDGSMGNNNNNNLDGSNMECNPIEEAPDEDGSQQQQEIKMIPNNNIKRLSLGVVSRQNRNDNLRRSNSEGAAVVAATTTTSRRGSTYSSTNNSSSKRSSGSKRSSIWSYRSSMFLNRKRDSLGDNLDDSMGNNNNLDGSNMECNPIEEADVEEEQQGTIKPTNRGGRISRKDRIHGKNNRGSLGARAAASMRGSLMRGISMKRRNNSGNNNQENNNNVGGSKLRKTATLERMESLINLNTNKEEGYNTVGAAGADRLQFALRKLINVVSSFAPLILVFDDVQWADSASLDLLKGWITDEGNPKLGTIWIYRKDIVGLGHFVTKSIDEIEELKQERSITVHKIEVGQLQTEDITAMISDTLDCSDTKATELSRILQQKTHGNVFYLRQYLQLLAQRGLLTHQMATMSWDWDLEAIRNRCSATENVVDLMKEKLEQSPAACMLLPLAACLGATFDTRVLQAILEGLKETKDSDIVHIFSTALGREVGELLEEDGKQLLGLIQMEGLIDVAGPTASFMHDRVMEGALALVKDGMLEDLKFGMGHLLLLQLESKQEHWVEDALFLVVDLLNCRIELIPATRQLDVCELNLLAGDKAHLGAAYSRSAIYYNAAIKLLPEGHWGMLYDTSLHLYISAAEAEMCLGQYEKMRTYVNYVLELDCPLLDKLPAYKVLIDAHMAKAELLETLNLNDEVLKHLGCHFPKSCILARTSVALTNMKMRKKRWKPETLAELPISSNPVHEAISQLHGIYLIAVMVAKPQAFPLAIIMACEHVLNYGLTRYSALSLAWLTVVIINAHGDYKWAKEHMEFTQSLLQRLPNRRIESRVNATAGIFVNHWTAPIHNSIRPLIASYSRGMETCDFESAFWCAHFYLESSLFAGRSLALLQKDVETYCKQEVDYGMMKHAESLQCLWQLILNLRGCSDNTILLTGTAHDEAAVLELIKKSGDVHLLAHLQKDRLFAAAIFGEFEHGAKLGMSSLDLICKGLGGQHSTLISRFIVGLCCFEMARKTKKKKYLKSAVKNLNVIKTWSEKGNPNARHYLTFLQAEKAVCAGKKDKAISLYERTILLSGRSGYNHDCALASERLATFSLSLGDHSSAKDRFQDSIKLYDEWGATKKVELMKEKMQPQFTATQ